MLNERQILNIVGEELSQSAGGNENDFLDANRQAALGAYLGQPDGKETEGRSTIISTDIADAIEWIMPEIVKAFTQNNDVVTFDPVGEGDEEQAELESSFVYDILMKDNNGFLVLHQFIKDALMQKNGFVKIIYVEDEEVKSEYYTGLTKEEATAILSHKLIDMTQLTEEDGLYSMKVNRTCSRGRIEVISVPPEEFRVNKMHNSVDLSTARFTSHSMLKSASDLIKEGFDQEVIDEIPTAEQFEQDREYRFYMQDETVTPGNDVSSDPSVRFIEINESYMNMDIDEDGVAEFVKITTAGGDNPDTLLDVEEIEENPFISSTAILMSHKLFGLSIYDRLKSIQDQKTTLWRNIFDNMYLQNNQIKEVVEGQVNLDDLMVSRPGGLVRVKRAGSVTPLVTPPLGPDAYNMMGYLDQVRSGRTGVSPEGAVTDSMIGDRVGSEGIEKMMNQKEELVGLMIRVIAETGVKPMCEMIRNQAIRHQDVVEDYKFRGKWIKVEPMSWSKRSRTTVRVGTGSGNRKEQMGALNQVFMLQEKIMMNPGQALVKEEQVYNAANDFAKFAGMPGINKYLIDPSSPEGQKHRTKVDQSQQEQQQAQQAIEQAQQEANTKIADAETQKAKAEMANVQIKGQLESTKNELALLKQKSDAEMAAIRLQLEEATAMSAKDDKQQELDFKYWDANEKHDIAHRQIDTTAQMAKDNNDNDKSDD